MGTQRGTKGRQVVGSLDVQDDAVIGGSVTSEGVTLRLGNRANVYEPTGGTTVDVEARAAIVALIAILQDVGVLASDTVPEAPTNLVATPGDGQASIAFDAPLDGGDAIVDYEYALDGGAWTSGSVDASPVVITGLDNDVEVSIVLRAVNGVGGGAASAAVLATPTA